jgi:hypothetical protein
MNWLCYQNTPNQIQFHKTLHNGGYYMMILEAGEVCPYGRRCPHNNGTMSSTVCYGTISTRPHKFECKFVVNGQILTDSGTITPGDKTGKMRVILE